MTYTMMVSSKGQVSIPLEVRRKLGIKKGDRVSLKVVSKKDKKLSLVVKSTQETIDELFGSLGGGDVKYVPLEKVREIAGKKLGEKYRVDSK